jgi:hypothetical protein
MSIYLIQPSIYFLAPMLAGRMVPGSAAAEWGIDERCIQVTELQRHEIWLEEMY